MTTDRIAGPRQSWQVAPCPCLQHPSVLKSGTEPSQELVDRALAGWQRFLETFEGGTR